jgi:spore coat protein A
MSTTRRQFLGVVTTAGVGAMVPWRLGSAAEAVASAEAADAMAAAAAVGVSPVLTKFVTTVPIPPTITPVVGSTITLPMAQGLSAMHPALPLTPTWGYGGAPMLGPTIEARVGQPFSVQYRNDLPGTHLLAASIDPFVAGADPALYPPVRAVAHLHGGHIPHTVDGGPHAWYTNPLTEPLAPNGQPYPPNPMSHGDTYLYPMNQKRACSIWYHDHALGITRLNVYAGLAGFFNVRDAAEDALNLPSGAYEIPLAFQDRIFNADGTLYYPPAPHVPEFFGDTMIVNGKVWPRLVVEARKYRFRMLNGCTARVLRMQLFQSDLNGVLKISNKNKKAIPGPAFQQIGTEGGLMNQVATMPILTVAPGERCDVVIDFSAALAGLPAGSKNYFLLYNDAQTPFANTKSTMGAIPEVMLFEVVAATAPDTSLMPPPDPTRVIPLNPATATVTRNVTLSEIVDAQGNLMALLDGLLAADPATELPVLGTTEVWNIINLTPDTHPIHLHQTMFQILDRIPFDPKAYTKAWPAGALPIDPTPFYVGPALAPDANEIGWKDTIRANPAQVTRIIMTWEDYAGEYVWHCHILEHEDHDMMRPLIVQPAPVP